jgi:erythrocyte band 7 integral membrane protein
MITCLGDCNGFLGSVPCCCCFSNPYQTVPQGRVGLLSRFGKYYKTLDAGLFYVKPFTEQLLTIDMRMQIEDIPSQSIMTKDNVAVIIDSVLYWCVMEPFVVSY